MRDEAASLLLYKTALAVILPCGLLAYTVLIYQLGQQSAQSTYNLSYNGIEHHKVSKGVTRAYSVLEDMALNLAARISATGSSKWTSGTKEAEPPSSVSASSTTDK